MHPTGAKSNIGQGGLNLYSTIILDCQTKTAISCSENCIVFKTCTARKKRPLIRSSKPLVVIAAQPRKNGLKI
ncbi:MAG: hypothetical protein ACLQO7_05190 [Candidatus Bathyarchaeia archaeon]